MTRRVAQRELRNAYGDVLREVRAGHEVIVTQDGQDVARVVPIGRRPRSVSGDEMFRLLAGPLSDAAGFMAEVRPDDADRVLD